VSRLEEQDPPSETGPGYYPDPLGGRYQRWWDGNAWTSQVGPETGDPPTESKSIWWVVERYAGFATTSLVLIFLNGSVLTRVGVAIAAGLIVGYTVRFFFWLNPDRRPDPSDTIDT
jgi:hypothetical protein